MSDESNYKVRVRVVVERTYSACITHDEPIEDRIVSAIEHAVGLAVKEFPASGNDARDVEVIKVEKEKDDGSA